MIVTEGQRVIVGRYQLTAQIGSGGVAVLWRGRDTLLDRQVAVKEIVRLDAGGVADAPEEIYQRTLTEARASARIRHRGVAAVYDVISEADRPYIVMELIEGRSLAQVIEEDGPLALALVADIGRQVLAALTAGHAAGVLHRDLNPANVLVTSCGRAVLTDFGIASVSGNPSMTQTGIVLGTPRYLAPERLRGQAATPAADMWSLGATLYAALAGRGPYDAYDDVAATLTAITTQGPPGLLVDGPLPRVIRALLDRDPLRRPGAPETALVLEEAAGGLIRSRPGEDQLFTMPIVMEPPLAAKSAPATEPSVAIEPAAPRAAGRWSGRTAV
jgi:serine/threonine protein kinase